VLAWGLPIAAVVLWATGFGCYIYGRPIREFWARLRAPKDPG